MLWASSQMQSRALVPVEVAKAEQKHNVLCCVGLLQEHIESENARLEREQQFWAKEIVVKIEYKYCPNLTIIDTPGGPWGSRAPLCRHAAGCSRVALSQLSTVARASCKVDVASCCAALRTTWWAACCRQQSRLAADSVTLHAGSSIAGVAVRQTCQRLHLQLAAQTLRQSPLCFGAGLISAAPGRRNSMMQNSAKQVEGMVRQKMEQKEYILLCLEDTNDWSNATTRRLVMQVHRLNE